MRKTTRFAASCSLVLLGAEAGLRQGELIALEWGDVDLVAGILTVRRSSYARRGAEGDPGARRTLDPEHDASVHLAPSALSEAIGLLDFGQPVGSARSAAV